MEERYHRMDYQRDRRLTEDPYVQNVSDEMNQFHLCKLKNYLYLLYRDSRLFQMNEVSNSNRKMYREHKNVN